MSRAKRSMQRVAAGLFFAVVLSLLPYARAQEPPTEPQAATPATESSEPSIWWNVVNFAILIGFLGWLISKNAPAYFLSRTQQIQLGLREGAKAKQEGEQRVADMERRIAGLADEIEVMRARMRHDMAAEGERVRAETERHIRKIEESAQQEIENMTKIARRELELYAASLALESAKQQLRGRVDRDLENRLVTFFTGDLGALSRRGENRLSESSQ